MKRGYCKLREGDMNEAPWRFLGHDACRIMSLGCLTETSMSSTGEGTISAHFECMPSSRRQCLRILLPELGPATERLIEILDDFEVLCMFLGVLKSGAEFLLQLPLGDV